jgi:hypothetical protein
MSHKYLILLLLVPLFVEAQAPFVASWNFENNASGTTNNVNVTASNLANVNTNVVGYPAGATGDCISLSGWPTAALSAVDYVQITVTPQNYAFSVTSITFSLNRSNEGPTQIAVRSSANNFATDIGTSPVGLTFANAGFGVTFTNVETPVSFRIYGYSAGSGSGALRIDNLKVNGTVALIPLPVELTNFRGQKVDDKVELIWETAWERNAATFDIQRSHNAQEFSTLEQIVATGDTRERSRYAFLDLSPLPVTAYYRLRQTDKDGSFVYSKVISVAANASEPDFWIFGNPVTSNKINIHHQNMPFADFRLVNSTGQAITSYQDQVASNQTILTIDTNMPTGVYHVVGQVDGKIISRKIIINSP